MSEVKLITVEDVKKDDALLQKIINYYNKMPKYRQKNREKYNEQHRNYYYKINNKEPKTKNISDDKSEYQKQYRKKLKEKRELLKKKNEENTD